MPATPPTGYTAGTSSTTILEYHLTQGSPPATTLGFVKSVTLPNMSRSVLDATIITDTIKSYKPGIKEYNEVTVEMLYDSANAVLVSDNIADAGTCSWKMTFPDAGTLTFDGYVKSIGAAIPEGGDLITQSITIKVSADVAPTYSDGV